MSHTPVTHKERDGKPYCGTSSKAGKKTRTQTHRLWSKVTCTRCKTKQAADAS